ncbi:leukocyte surface antigen CD47 isoform X2 [Meriones unguiculatus]|uniref:leukocyte surface antigen CD47 isoform X2 n=1 Tax=Meriones unguiculatus TaxID=10047 RepID=UPI00293E9278|nr:leukocyte surface antigen CD47 isoform X2 [Meriones unguiculatus]
MSTSYNTTGVSPHLCHLSPMLSLVYGMVVSGSAQLLFSKVKSVEYTLCNKTVTIPCVVLNVEAQSTEEMYVKWKFNRTYIFIYDGGKNSSTPDPNFSSAKISVSDLLKGDASLKMDTNDAAVGNYTCEVTELSREGKTVIELKYRTAVNPDQGSACSNHTTPAGDEKEKGGCRLVSWFSPNEKILIVIFPILAILLFWGKFGILNSHPLGHHHCGGNDVFIHITLKYKSSRTNKKIILLLATGVVLTAIVVVGAILLIPGENPVKNAAGLGLIVISVGILIPLQYNVFMTAFGMTSFTIAILITQVLGYVLALVGLCLCIMACEPVHGPLLISGLGIIALAELLGLVYMKFVASNQRTIQPPRKAVEEPLNE